MSCERVEMIRLENPVLYRKAALCEEIERELMSVLGVDRYETSSRNGRAKIEYDPLQLGPAQIIEILDGALANAEYSDKLDSRSSNWRSVRLR
jgi:copper chaperone CopZ